MARTGWKRQKGCFFPNWHSLVDEEVLSPPNGRRRQATPALELVVADGWMREKGGRSRRSQTETRSPDGGDDDEALVISVERDIAGQGAGLDM